MVIFTAILVLERVQRAWNQTGVKWLGAPDIGKWLVHENNAALLSVLNFVALSLPCIWGITNLQKTQALHDKASNLFTNGPKNKQINK